MKALAGITIGILLLTHELVFSTAAGVDETKPCTETFENETGNYDEQFSPENMTCQYTFDMTDRPSFKFLYITFNNFSLATRDYVTVFSNYTKPRAMIGNFTGSRTSFMVASSTNITSVRLVARPHDAKLLRQLSFSWNTVCEQTLEAPAVFASPVFIARASYASMECDYTLLVGDGAGLALSVQQVDIKNGSAIVNSNGSLIANYSESTDDVVIGDGLVDDTAIVTVTLNASIYQKGLAGSFISLTPGCSGNVTLKAGEQYQFASPGFPGVFNHAASCRLLIQTIEPNTTLVARIDVLGLVDDYDIIVVKDGRSKMSPTIVQIDKGFSTDYVIMSSNDSLWFEFTSEASLSPKSFSFNISVQYFGGTFEQSGSIMLNQSKVPAGGARNLKEYYKLVVAGDSQVYLNVSNASFVPSNSNLKFYNGDRVDGNQLISKLLKSSTMQPVFSDGNVMLVVAEGFSGANAFFNASFKTEKKGCYQHSWVKSDSYSLLPGHEPENCSWLIHPPANIKKGDLLSVDLTHVRSASASIYNNAAPSTLVMALNASQLSTGFTLYMDAAKGARIQYVASSGNPNRLAIFEASYHVRKACEGYHNSTSGQVRSPGHPNLYPLNANCSYMLGLDQQKDKSLVYLSFRALQISSGHVLKIQDGRELNATVLLNATGTTLPNDVVTSKNAMHLTFSSQTAALRQQMPGAGFQADYAVIDCGGMITLPKGIVSTPGYPKMLKKNTTCVWVVSFPPQDGDSVNVVKYSFLINGTAYQPGSVEIRDGSSVRSDIVDVGTVVINKMSTNMTRSSGLWVKYSVRLVKGSAPAFRLNFTKYACPKTQQCDNGVCMQDNWKCNGNNDCGDNSDEMDCGGKPVPGSTGISVTVFVVTLLVVTALTIAATLLIQRYVLRARSPYSQFQDNAAEA